MKFLKDEFGKLKTSRSFSFGKEDIEKKFKRYFSLGEKVKTTEKEVIDSSLQATIEIRNNCVQM
jgi:hypothetical protein